MGSRRRRAHTARCVLDGLQRVRDSPSQQRVLNRVQDAIDIGAPYNTTAVTAPSFYGGVPMDITQDFFVGSTALTFSVPAAARYLFIGVPDSFVGDNSSPDPANFGVLASQTTTVPEPRSVLLLTVSLGVTGVMTRRVSAARRNG